MKRRLYRLSLTGVFTLVCQKEPIELRFEKAQALLVLLIACGGKLARSEIASGLWSDLEPEAARNNLRLTLYRLRQALKGAEQLPFGSDRRTIWLESDRFLSLPDPQEARQWLQARGLWAHTEPSTLEEISLFWLMALFGQRLHPKRRRLWEEMAQVWPSGQMQAPKELIEPALEGWAFTSPYYRRALLLALEPERIRPALFKVVGRLLGLARGAIRGGVEVTCGVRAAAKALALLRHLPAQPDQASLAIDLELVLATLLQHRKGPGCAQAGVLLDRAAERAADLGLIDRVFSAYFNRWQSSLVGGDPWVADESARRLERFGTHGARSRAAVLLTSGRNRLVGGELGEAIGLLERAASLCENHPSRLVLGGMDIGVLSWASLSEAYWLKGALIQADEAADRALTLAAESEAIARCACAAVVGAYYRMDGRVEALSKLANEGMRIASKAQLPFWQMACFFQNVWTLIQGGQREAVALMEGRLKAMEQSAGSRRAAHFLTVLEGYFEAGSYGQCAQGAQQAIEQGLCEQEVLISEYYRIWGRALAKLGSGRESIDRCYQKGMEYASYFQSPTLKLALAMDRAYYLLGQKAPQEAAALLRAHLEPFEGIDPERSSFLLKGVLLLRRVRQW